MGIEIRVLGPLAVAREDGSTAALGPSQRRLLAALCVNADRVVPSERLADMLGLSSSASVRTTVHRIRQATGDVIRHQPPGYVIEGDALDAQRFLRLQAEARAATPADAVDLYREALALWRGNAYAEFADEEWAQAEAVRLDELHVTTRSEHVDALAGCGRVADAIAEAERLIRDQPFRERPRAQLMTALARQGRQTDALRAYQDFRSFLGEEVGVDPSPELTELEQRIVAGESIGDDAPVAAAATVVTRHQPEGTVTFLFTQLEESTVRWENAPDEMQDALAAHDAHLKMVVDANDGWIFAHTGDGIAVAFDSASAAIRAAIAAQLGTLPVPVRIGIATGEAERRDDNYFGPIVNRTARIMSAAHGGQIVVAASTAAMVDGIDFRDLGSHRLRDVAEPISLVQVEADALDHDFPPLRTDSLKRGNLPARPHHLLGRDTEIQALTQLLKTQRLVSLTGSGGVGKTSLALHVAHQLASDFPDGVWWIELAAVRDPAGLPEAVAGALQIQPSGDTALIGAIQAGLGEHKALIVLDNCEHLLDEAAAMATALLSASQDIALIATSREHLRIAGERVWSVPALDSSTADSPAVALFIERARAVAPDFDAEGDRDSIVEICRRLDGVAFAIELAAARMVSMTPADVRSRLADRFRLLSVPRRGLEHHQTLRQTVQWSYELLDPNERTLLTGLSVFVDGFSLDAAREVAAPDWDEFEVLDLIESLVRKSLLTTERVGGHVRYGMLETIRDFGRETLVDEDRMADHERRHASHFSRSAETQWYRWQGADQREAVEWGEIELANLRAAFRAARQAGDLDAASSLAAHGTFLLQIQQRYEPVSWIEEVIDAATDAEVPLLPRLYGAAQLASMAGRPAEAARFAKRADELELVDDHETSQAWSLFFRAVTSRYLGHFDEYAEQCRELSEGNDTARALGIGGRLSHPGSLESLDEIRALGDEATAISHRIGNPFIMAFQVSAYGRALAAWEPVEALGLLREAHMYAQKAGLSFWIATIAREIAVFEARYGDTAAALEHFATAFTSFQRNENRNAAGIAFGALSATFHRMGRAEAAATLYGCHRSLQRTTYLPAGLELPPDDAHNRDAIARGEAMDLAEGLQYARREIDAAREELSSRRSS